MTNLPSDKMIPCYFTLPELEHISAVLATVAEDWLAADPSHVSVGATHSMLTELINEKIANEYENQAAQWTAMFSNVRAAFSPQLAFNTPYHATH
jgi:hypothetical protein